MDETISKEYRELNKQLHDQRDDYGANGRRWGQVVIDVAQSLSTRNILDYGAGKRSLERSLPLLEVRSYDPAIEGISDAPEEADVVVCTDVLEHIEPEYLEAVLDDIQRLSKKAAVVVVATREAMKSLPDGRNTHLIVEPYTWWLPKLTDRFNMVSFNKTGDEEFLVVLHSLKKTEEEEDLAEEKAA